MDPHRQARAYSNQLLRVILSLCILPLIAACAAPPVMESPKFVGDWVDSSGKWNLTIGSDGTITMAGQKIGQMNGDSKFELSDPNSGATKAGTYAVDQGGLSMTIDGQTAKLTKTMGGGSAKEEKEGNLALESDLHDLELKVASFAAGNSLVLEDVMKGFKNLKGKRSQMTASQSDRLGKAMEAAGYEE